MTQLVVQSFYHIELLNTWNNKKYDAQIVGMVSPNTLNELDSAVNIRKEFFTDYNLGISKYMMLITDSTPIYVLKPIKSYDPVETDEENRFYVPLSLIDFSKSFEYIRAKRYDFTTYTGIKYFDTVLTEDKFLTEAETKISEVVGNLNIFTGDNVSSSVVTTDVLTTKDKLDLINRNRKIQIDFRENAIKQNKDSLEEMERNLYVKLKSAEKAEKDYETQKNQLLTQFNEINALRVSNEHENQILMGVKNIMIEMIGIIKAGNMSPESFPTFDELYNQAESVINDGE